jgi:hypothetical protein
MSFHVRGWLVIPAYDYERNQRSQLYREKKCTITREVSIFNYAAQQPGASVVARHNCGQSFSRKNSDARRAALIASMACAQNRFS